MYSYPDFMSSLHYCSPVSLHSLVLLVVHVIVMEPEPEPCPWYPKNRSTQHQAPGPQIKPLLLQTAYKSQRLHGK